MFSLVFFVNESTVFVNEILLPDTECVILRSDDSMDDVAIFTNFFKLSNQINIYSLLVV